MNSLSVLVNGNNNNKPNVIPQVGSREGRVYVDLNLPRVGRGTVSKGYFAQGSRVYVLSIPGAKDVALNTWFVFYFACYLFHVNKSYQGMFITMLLERVRKGRFVQ